MEELVLAGEAFDFPALRPRQGIRIAIELSQGIGRDAKRDVIVVPLWPHEGGAPGIGDELALLIPRGNDQTPVLRLLPAYFVQGAVR